MVFNCDLSGMSVSAEDEGSIEEIDIELGMLLAGFSNACKVLKKREEKRKEKRREVEKHRREKKRRVKRNSKKRDMKIKSRRGASISQQILATMKYSLYK